MNAVLSTNAGALPGIARHEQKNGCVGGRKRHMRRNFYPKSFGRRVKLLREDLEIGQLELANQVSAKHGVSFTQSYLSKLESGEKMPGGEIVLALAIELATTTDFLLGRTTDPNIPQEKEEPTIAISPEGEQVAKLIDALSPEKRQEAQRLVQSLYEEEALRRTRNAELWQSLLGTVEKIAGHGVRQQVEQALIADSLEVAGNRTPN